MDDDLSITTSSETFDPKLTEAEEHRSGFIRQRRNLFILATLVISYILLDLELTTKSSILGNSFLVGKPENLNIILFFGLVYFLFRYYQYHNTMPKSNFYITHQDRIRFNRKILVRDKCAELIKNQHKKKYYS